MRSCWRVAGDPSLPCSVLCVGGVSAPTDAGGPLRACLLPHGGAERATVLKVHGSCVNRVGASTRRPSSSPRAPAHAARHRRSTGHALAVVGGEVFLFGGEEVCDERTILADLYRLELRGNVLAVHAVSTRLARGPRSPRRRHTAARRS